jgi:tetratricopeptide (TPR) repeat protein
MEGMLNLILSSCAFLLSAAALLFNVSFNHRERKRNIRQTLTSTLNDVAKINIEISKLKKEEEGDSPDKVEQRRNYDFQRGAMIMEADFLINENPKVLTAIDCSLTAFTYSELGDFKKAEHYWNESIVRSQTKELKHIHSRDYASFLFQQNRMDQGRKKFKEALAIELNKTDDDLMVVIDTYLLWASAEYFFGNEKDFTQYNDAADEISKKISNRNKCREMKLKIENSRHLSVEKKDKSKNNDTDKNKNTDSDNDADKNKK